MNTNENLIPFESKCKIQSLCITALTLAILSYFFPVIGFILSIIALATLGKAKKLGGGILTGLGASAKVLSNIALVFNTIYVAAIAIGLITSLIGALIGGGIMAEILSEIMGESYYNDAYYIYY